MKIGRQRNWALVLWISVAIVLMAIVTTVAVTGAWFTDSAESNNSSTLAFGTVSVSATPENYSAEYFFTPTELTPNATNKTITKTLTIQNTGDVAIYTRFTCTISFTDGTPLNNMLTLTGVSTASSTWNSTYASGYYIYCTTDATPTAKQVGVGSGQNSIVATLTFTLSSNFGNPYANKTLRVVFNVDAVQAANNGPALSATTWVN